jgi:hypothetical protein
MSVLATGSGVEARDRPILRMIRAGSAGSTNLLFLSSDLLIKPLEQSFMELADSAHGRGDRSFGGAGITGILVVERAARNLPPALNAARRISNYPALKRTCRNPLGAAVRSAARAKLNVRQVSGSVSGGE